MIKYIFSDIDGTLYVNEDISKHDVAAVNDFVAAGGVFALATGRTDLEISNFAKEEKLPTPTFRISGNGSVAYDRGELIYQTQFSNKAKYFLKTYLSSHLDELAVVEVSTPNHIYFLMEPEDWVLNYKGDNYTINPHTLAHFEDVTFDITKMYIEGQEDFITNMITAIEKDYGEEIEIFSDITAVNIGPKGNTKGTAINKLLFKHGILPEQIAVIGDAANDIGMFEITPNSFAFDYSLDFVQNSATHIVKNVAEAIDIINQKNAAEAEEEN
ncbi:haloacid dehalogenase [Erysipelotrichaceae bacterium]|nr:haloacid dehalogenase [Erysipelotrichaceae bacterium]